MSKSMLGLLITVILLPLQGFAGSTIRVVADEWAPFGGQDLPNGGISLDVISAVLTRAGYTVSVEIVPWERAVQGTQDGTYDVLGNLFKDVELEKTMTFSDPFYNTEVRFVQKAGGEIEYSSLDSLRPYTIAVGAGYLYEEAFDHADDLRKHEVTTVVQGVRMVASGRVDLTLDSMDVINHVLRNSAPELAEQVTFLSRPLSTRNVHMGVRNDLPVREKLVGDFNRVLAEMQADGSLDGILAKHSR
jgi:polar amino acid transport system substrate-binding protein